MGRAQVCLFYFEEWPQEQLLEPHDLAAGQPMHLAPDFLAL